MRKGTWKLRSPCFEADIRALIDHCPGRLPTEYLQYLHVSNGGYGDLGSEHCGLLHLWPAEELPEHNDGYEVQQWVPGFYAIGTSGGGEMFAIDLRDNRGAVVVIPFIPMDARYAIEIAPDFTSFIKLFGVSLDPPDDVVVPESEFL